MRSRSLPPGGLAVDLHAYVPRRGEAAVGRGELGLVGAANGTHLTTACHGGADAIHGESPSGRDPSRKAGTFGDAGIRPALGSGPVVRPLPPGRPAMVGDRGPFELEAASCRADLVRYALRLTGSRADADDLAQETLLKALQAWRTYRPGTRMLAWLRTILYRLFVDEYNDRKRESALESLMDRGAVSGARPRGGGGPWGGPSDGDLTATLEEALNRLSPAYRDVVRLADVEGFTGDEAAELLGVPVGTVKSRLFRARRLLRAPLRETAREMGYGMVPG